MNTTTTLMESEDKINLVTSVKKVIEKIFKLDLSEEDEDLQYCFKVLIFDDYTYEILCPLLKVKILQKNFYFISQRKIINRFIF